MGAAIIAAVAGLGGALLGSLLGKKPANNVNIKDSFNQNNAKGADPKKVDDLISKFEQLSQRLAGLEKLLGQLSSQPNSVGKGLFPQQPAGFLPGGGPMFPGLTPGLPVGGGYPGAASGGFGGGFGGGVPGLGGGVPGGFPGAAPAGYGAPVGGVGATPGFGGIGTPGGFPGSYGTGGIGAGSNPGVGGLVGGINGLEGRVNQLMNKAKSGNISKQEQMELMQAQQKLTELFNIITQIMKADHDAKMAAIRNMSG